MNRGEKWFTIIFLLAVILTFVLGLKESAQKELRRQKAAEICEGYIVEIKSNSGFFCVTDPSIYKFKESK